jgi:UDP-glucose 4-epimerase
MPIENLHDHFQGKDVLITGGIGFIGSHLARRLVSLGAKVTVVDSLIPQYGGNQFNMADIAQQISVNIADVRDPHSLSL